MALSQAGMALADAICQSLTADFVSDDAAELARSVFPHAVSLRVHLVTGDPEVLASVGSFLVPGPLHLALVPLRASAAGAAVVRGAPIYLTQDARQSLACYDFEGGSIFCLPLLEPAGATSAAATSAPAAAAGAAPPRCIGALLLSFPEAGTGGGGQEGSTAGPPGLDAMHARNLRLLAVALAPGLATAAAAVVQQCNVFLGVLQPEEAAEEGPEEEPEEAASEVWLTDLEEMEGIGSDVEVEGGEEGEGEAGPATAGEARPAGEEEGGGAPGPQWAAGGCRGGDEQPPDPGASSSAVLVAAPKEAEAAEHRAHGATAWRERQERQQVPESPSAIKARAHAAGAAGFAGTAPPRFDPGSSSGSSPGSADTAWSQLCKLSPGSEAGSARSGTPAPAVGNPERQAGATWRRLLRFSDPVLEARFRERLHRDLWRADVATVALLLSLQWALRSTTTIACGSGAGGPGVCSARPSAGALLLLGGTLALLLAGKHMYLRHRDTLLTLCVACASWQNRVVTAGTHAPWLPMLPLLLLLAAPARLCVQVPTQALLLATSGAWLVSSVCADLAELLWLAVSLAAALLPLLVLARLELRARRCFLADLAAEQHAGAAAAPRSAQGTLLHMAAA